MYSRPSTSHFLGPDARATYRGNGTRCRLSCVIPPGMIRHARSHCAQEPGRAFRYRSAIVSAHKFSSSMEAPSPRAIRARKPERCQHTHDVGPYYGTRTAVVKAPLDAASGSGAGRPAPRKGEVYLPSC